MPGTDPAMPVVRACWCGRQTAGEMPCCLEHATGDDLRHDWPRLHSLLLAAREENVVLSIRLDLMREAYRDVVTKLAALKAEIATLRDEPPSTEQAPVIGE